MAWLKGGTQLCLLQVVKIKLPLENDLLDNFPARFPQVDLNRSFPEGHYRFASVESQTQAFNSVGTQRKKKYSVKRFLLDTLHFFLLLCINIVIKYQSLGVTCRLQEVNLYLKCQSTNHTEKHLKHYQ